VDIYICVCVCVYVCVHNIIYISILLKIIILQVQHTQTCARHKPIHYVSDMVVTKVEIVQFMERRERGQFSEIIIRKI